MQPIHWFKNTIDSDIYKKKLLKWANHFNSCCFLDNHNYQNSWQQKDWLLACGSIRHISLNANTDALGKLQQFLNNHAGSWIFGHLGYGLTSQTEKLQSRHGPGLAFSDLHFFVPEIVIGSQQNKYWIQSEKPVSYEDILAQIDRETLEQPIFTPVKAIPILSKRQYLSAVNALQRHIARGDCYEINFCQEFVAEAKNTNTISLYQSLSKISPNPYACFYKQQNATLLCASPERFLKRQGQQIISQPIKGTSPRFPDNKSQDEASRQYLLSSEKDKRENVMVVDLVRNDLAKVCLSGSVQVEELFGVYTYPQVYQMISTVSGTINQTTLFTDLLAACFPMGSMTGAPKRRVVQLIDEFEASPRGLFSGSVGYIEPNGNFDFNVVIRSLVHDAANERLSFHVGSGITHYSQPLQEYEECTWKAKAIQQVLNGY